MDSCVTSYSILVGVCGGGTPARGGSAVRCVVYRQWCLLTAGEGGDVVMYRQWCLLTAGEGGGGGGVRV